MGGGDELVGGIPLGERVRLCRCLESSLTVADGG